MPNYGVASLFKMLTYSHVCSAFSSAHAFSLNVICSFEMPCKYLKDVADKALKGYFGCQNTCLRKNAGKMHIVNSE
jgi:hypothetical protein